jgi:hypothetical protein
MTHGKLERAVSSQKVSYRRDAGRIPQILGQALLRECESAALTREFVTKVPWIILKNGLTPVIVRMIRPEPLPRIRQKRDIPIFVALYEPRFDNLNERELS